MHELARRAAAVTGRSQTGAVEQALEMLLRSYEVDPAKARHAATVDVVRGLVADYAADPGSGHREVDRSGGPVRSRLRPAAVIVDSSAADGGPAVGTPGRPHPAPGARGARPGCRWRPGSRWASWPMRGPARTGRGSTGSSSPWDRAGPGQRAPRGGGTGGVPPVRARIGFACPAELRRLFLVRARHGVRRASAVRRGRLRAHGREPGAALTSGGPPGRRKSLRHGGSARPPPDARSIPAPRRWLA